MNIQALEDLLAKSELNTLQKNLLSRFIARAKHEQNKKNEYLQLVEQVANERRVSEILYSNDEVIIYSINGKDEWDIKYPIRGIFINENKVWKRIHNVSPSFDLAYLNYLEKKHLGDNSQFTDFAIKMLGIKIEE